MTTDQSVTLDRLEDQIRWYSTRSRIAQSRYKALKVFQVVVTALIPALAIFDLQEGPKISALLGIVVLISEGLLQLNQYQANWITYRSTCEALKHEKFTYLASAGPYADAQRPMAMLADRIEGLISQEHTRWVSTQEKTKPAETGKASDA